MRDLTLGVDSDDITIIETLTDHVHGFPGVAGNYRNGVPPLEQELPGLVPVVPFMRHQPADRPWE